MTETLYKIRSNAFSAEEFHEAAIHIADTGGQGINWDNDDYYGEYYDEDDFDEDEYGMESNKYMQKVVRKNKKVNNKTNSNILTAKVKK